MQKRKYSRMLVFGTDDARLLKSIEGVTGATGSDVIRWALRFYALRGPWTGGREDLREDIVGKSDSLEVGPPIREGTP